MHWSVSNFTAGGLNQIVGLILIGFGLGQIRWIKWRGK
jgi:hypothetical protein